MGYFRLFILGYIKEFVVFIAIGQIVGIFRGVEKKGWHNPRYEKRMPKTGKSLKYLRIYKVFHNFRSALKQQTTFIGYTILWHSSD